jgi:hypothetical protein
MIKLTDKIIDEIYEFEPTIPKETRKKFVHNSFCRLTKIDKMRIINEYKSSNKNEQYSLKNRFPRFSDYYQYQTLGKIHYWKQVKDIFLQERFCSLIPDKYKNYTIYDDDDFHFALEWDMPNNINLSIGFYKNRYIVYSIFGQYASDSGHIEWDFKTFPKEILKLLEENHVLFI